MHQPLSATAEVSRTRCRAKQQFRSIRHCLVLAAGRIATAASVGTAASPAGETLDAARRQFFAGQYHECRDTARKAIAAGATTDDWAVLKAETELTIGEYAAARATAEAGLRRFPDSLSLRVLCARACQRMGQGERVAALLAEIERFAARTPWRYSRADDLLALGEAALMAGADPREVREGFFERARRLNPSRREPVLALGRL